MKQRLPCFFATALRRAARAALSAAWPAAKGARAKPAHVHDLVTAYVRGAADGAAAANALARGALHGLPVGDARAVSAEFPSLTAATLPVWYGAVWDGLLAHWKGAAAAAARAGGDDPAAALDAHARVATAAADAAASLTSIARRHETAGGLHATAVKGVTSFVAGFLATLPLWRRAIPVAPASSVATLDRVTASLRKATRAAHVLLGEGKARRDPGLAAAAPAARRAMERVVVAVAALCGGGGAAGGAAAPGVVVGQLKHRDLQGRVVGSQLEGDSEEDEEAGASVGNSGEGGDGDEAAADSGHTSESDGAGPAPGAGAAADLYGGGSQSE